MKNKLYIDYILMQTLYFVLMGVMYGYSSFVLLQLGYSTSKVGLIMSMGSLLSTCIQPIAATVSDKSKKLSLFNVCIIISLCCVILSTTAFVQKSASLLTTISYVGILGTFAAFEPLVNTVPTILENNGLKINYGVGRAAGSLGYAGANFLLGILTSKFPFQVVLACASISSILLLLVNIKANKDFLAFKTTAPEKPKEEKNISYWQFLSRHKFFVILMVCEVGIYLGYMMVDNMMYLVVSNVGGNTTDLGMIMAFKACLEVPVIFFYDKIEKIAKSPENLLKLSAIAFIVKGVLIASAKSVTGIYIAQLAQMACISIEIPAMVSYISNIMDNFEEVRGQALYIMAVSIAGIMAATLSGSLSEYYSTSTMLLVSCAITSLSVIAFLFMLKKKD